MLPHHPTGYRDQTKQAIVCYFVSAVTIHGRLSLQSARTRRTVNSLGSGECQEQHFNKICSVVSSYNFNNFCV